MDLSESQSQSVLMTSSKYRRVLTAIETSPPRSLNGSICNKEQKDLFVHVIKK